MGKTGEDRLQEIIQKAVEQGIKAGYQAAKKENKHRFNAYRATEERLYSLPVLIGKVEKDRERLQELKQDPHLPRRSKDICRFKRAGVRLTDEEILDGLVQDLNAKIAGDEFEIQTIQEALEIVKGDAHHRTLTGRYFDNISDLKIAEELGCDESTVWRNRKRLVKRVSVRLYGVEAVQKQ